MGSKVTDGFTCKLLKGKLTFELVGAIGFEPTTPCAQGRCATRLRYAPTVLIIANLVVRFISGICQRIKQRIVRQT